MKRAISKGCLIGALAAAAAAMTEPAFAAVVINVTSTDDTDVNDANCTLREAIIAININNSYHGCPNTISADTIDLPSNIGGTASGPASISLQSALPVSSGLPRTIRGKGWEGSVIIGNGLPGLRVSAGTLNVDDVMLMDFGRSASGAAMTVEAGASGSLDHVWILSAGDEEFSTGGCIQNSGSLGVYYSQLELCNGFSGGAIQTFEGSFTTIQNSTILKSHAEHGVINNQGGTLGLFTSTMGANTAGVDAGAIINKGGSVTIASSTLAYSMFTLGTGSANVLFNNNGSMHVGNSVIFGDPSASGSDCVGTITSDGNNAVRTGAGCNFAASGDRAVSDPQLQPAPGPESGFTNLPIGAGGVGRVYLPASTSPLVNQFHGSPQDADQRGVRRNLAGWSDIGAVQRGNALLVVGNTNLSGGDAYIKSLLTNYGLTVTTVSDTASASSDANGKTVVVISESVLSGNVNTKFRATAAGVVVNEPFLFDDMNMTTASNLGTSNENTLNLARTTVGSNAGWIGPTQMGFGSLLSFGWGIPAASAQVQASNVGTPSHKHIFYYPHNSTMANGFVAPGRRVGTCFTDASMAVMQGLGFLEASILLAAGP